MKYMFYVLIAVFSMTACVQSGETGQFSELESQVEANPTNANVSELLTGYLEWLRANPEATSERKDVLLKMYSVSKEHIRLNNQLQSLQSLIVDYNDDPETLERLIELSDLYDKLRRQSAGLVLNQQIVRQYNSQEAVDPIRAKIPEDSPRPRDIVDGLAGSMFDTNTLRLDQPVARQYVDACEAYAVSNPSDPDGAELLHKAAETARTLGTLTRAISLYDWILTHYPDHPRAPQSLFLKAFTYDSNLGDFENARVYYQEFIDKYPEDDFASSAEFLLENLGKDDEELLEILQNKADNDDPTE